MTTHTELISSHLLASGFGAALALLCRNSMQVIGLTRKHMAGQTSSKRWFELVSPVILQPEYQDESQHSILPWSASSLKTME